MSQRGASRIHNELTPEDLTAARSFNKHAEWVEVSRLGWWDLIQVRAARRRRTESLDKLLFARGSDGSRELESRHGLVNAHGDSILHVACLENHIDTV